MVPRLLTALPTPGRGGICPCCEEMITVEELTEDTSQSQQLPVATKPAHH